MFSLSSLCQYEKRFATKAILAVRFGVLFVGWYKLFNIFVKSRDTRLNKSPGPTKLIQILIPKIHNQFIKTYTSQYNKNMIHSLSYNTLTEDELSVFTKGLSSVTTPTKTFKQKLNESF